MTPRKAEILDLFLAGKDPKAIASSLGITRRAVSDVIGTDEFQGELRRLRGWIHERHFARLLAAADKAIDVLDAALAGDLDSKDERHARTRLRAAEATLQLIYGRAPAINIDNRQVTIAPEEIPDRVRQIYGIGPKPKRTSRG